MEVVFTGTFKVAGEHIVRELLVEAAEAKGYIVSNKVGPFTSVLVLGDTGHHGVTRKQKEAEAYGVKILTPDQFYDSL